MHHLKFTFVVFIITPLLNNPFAIGQEPISSDVERTVIELKTIVEKHVLPQLVGIESRLRVPTDTLQDSIRTLDSRLQNYETSNLNALNALREEIRGEFRRLNEGLRVAQQDISLLKETILIVRNEVSKEIVQSNKDLFNQLENGLGSRVTRVESEVSKLGFFDKLFSVGSVSSFLILTGYFVFREWIPLRNKVDNMYEHGCGKWKEWAKQTVSSQGPQSVSKKSSESEEIPHLPDLPESGNSA